MVWWAITSVVSALLLLAIIRLAPAVLLRGAAQTLPLSTATTCTSRSRYSTEVSTVYRGEAVIAQECTDVYSQGNLYPGLTSKRWLDAFKKKLSQEHVVAGENPLARIDSNLECRLIICRCRECLRPFTSPKPAILYVGTPV